MEITISLSPPHPHAGHAHIVVRLGAKDRLRLHMAADAMGMTTARLARILLVRGAEQLLDDDELLLVKRLAFVAM